MLDLFLSNWFRLPQGVRYLFVGGYNTAFSLLLFALLYYIAGDNMGYITLSIISHFISVFNSTITFRWFVFSNGKDTFIIQYIRTNVSYLGYLAVNTALLYLFVSKMAIHPVLAAFINVCILTPIFFFIHKIFSFKEI